MADLLSLAPEELADKLKAMGQSAFRARQLYSWLVRGVDYDGMTNLPRALREALAAEGPANPVRILRSVVSQKDGTEKYLYELCDGNIVEGVTMRYNYGDTLCVSTQVGCRMGCRFCASTLEGCVRDLTPGELLGQIIAVNAHLRNRDGAAEHIGNVVLMGSGEPLDNYDNVVKFLRLMNREDGLHMSLRGVSLSTCGLVPHIYDLADEGLPVTLCISLHAPNDDIRKQLMPIANRYAMDDILDACRNYIERTGRRVIFEYALVGGVNCAPEHARELASRLRNMQCHVNLIPLNDVPERDLRAPGEAAMRAFEAELKRLHISVSRRREMGDDIEGACGQLRRAYLNRADASSSAEGNCQ